MFHFKNSKLDSQKIHVFNKRDYYVMKKPMVKYYLVSSAMESANEYEKSQRLFVRGYKEKGPADLGYFLF